MKNGRHRSGGHYLVVKFLPPRERGWGDDTEGEVRCMARYGMVVE
jgi:hypothetical protein